MVRTWLDSEVVRGHSCPGEGMSYTLESPASHQMLLWSVRHQRGTLCGLRTSQEE